MPFSLPDHIYGLKGLLNDEPSVIVGTNEEGHEELGNARKNLSFYHEIPFTIGGYEPLLLQDGMTLHHEGLADIEVMATPGHSPSCITYKIGNDLFTGDAYISGVKTFTSFPRGNTRSGADRTDWKDSEVKASINNGIRLPKWMY